MSDSNITAPPMKRGWLRKQARSGIMKNWQTRYFVLNNGKISYYQEQLDRAPYGDILKGELDLFDATLSRDIKKFSAKQIYILSRKGQKDLLAESDEEKDAKEWTEAIAAHIRYANLVNNADPEASLNRSISMKLDRNTTASFMDDAPPSMSQPSLNPSFNRSNSTPGGRDSEDNEAPSTSTFNITPKPAWVVKVLRNNGEKIFVNLTEHPDIPMMQLALNLGYNKWPFMIITPARTLHEEKGEEGNAEVSIYDAVVNPAVVNICAKDPQAKDATCLRIMRLLKKKFGEDLQLEYKLPKINKKYKGEIQQVLVPTNIQILARNRSSVHVQSTTLSNNSSLPDPNENAGKLNPKFDASPLQRKLSEPIAPSGGNNNRTSQSLSQRNLDIAPASSSSSANKKSSMTKLFNNLEDPAASPNNSPGLSRTYTEVNYNTVSNVRAGANVRSVRSSFLNPIVDKNTFKNNPDSRKIVVPYVIVRSNGITAKALPDKGSTGKILGHGVKVFVVARRIMPDHVAWLKTTEGWIMEKVFAGTIHRVATPCLYGQPISAKIINTRFEDHMIGGSIRGSYIGSPNTRESNGWFSFRASALKESFQTRFTFEIMHQDNAMIRISRTFSEVITLRAMLIAFNDKALKDRTLKAGEFPILHDGEDDLVDDVHLLIEVVESVENFLTKLFATVQVDRCKCKALKEFLTPKDTDFQLMEVELMAEGGLVGGWGQEIDEDLQGIDLTPQPN